jgi:hypothetical protein
MTDKLGWHVHGVSFEDGSRLADWTKIHESGSGYGSTTPTSCPSISTSTMDSSGSSTAHGSPTTTRAATPSATADRPAAWSSSATGRAQSPHTRASSWRRVRKNGSGPMSRQDDPRGREGRTRRSEVRCALRPETRGLTGRPAPGREGETLWIARLAFDQSTGGTWPSNRLAVVVESGGQKGRVRGVCDGLPR